MQTRHSAMLASAIMAFAWTASIAAPFPVQDLGVIDTYGVVNQATGGSWSNYPPSFPLDVKFTLASDMDVRMDTRWAGSSSKYVLNYFRDMAFTVYDSDHVAVGAGVDDIGYGNVKCFGDYSINGYCSRQAGLTFSGRLKAGDYTLSFTATRLDMVSPNVRIGVANLETANLSNYMAAVTPPSVPEPSQWMSMALGMLALAAVQGRRSARANPQG